MFRHQMDFTLYNNCVVHQTVHLVNPGYFFQIFMCHYILLEEVIIVTGSVSHQDRIIHLQGIVSYWCV